MRRDYVALKDPAGAGVRAPLVAGVSTLHLYRGGARQARAHWTPLSPQVKSCAQWKTAELVHQFPGCDQATASARLPTAAAPSPRRRTVLQPVRDGEIRM